MERLYDWDERTVLIQDVWRMTKDADDACYRCDILSRLKGEAEFAEIGKELKDIQNRLNILYPKIRMIDDDEKLSHKEGA